MLSGEGVTDCEIEYSNSRIAEVCLGSQFVTGVAILEQREHKLAGVRWHVVGSGDGLDGLCILFEHVYMIFKVWSCALVWLGHTIATAQNWFIECGALLNLY